MGAPTTLYTFMRSINWKVALFWFNLTRSIHKIKNKNKWKVILSWLHLTTSIHKIKKIITHKNEANILRVYAVSTNIHTYQQNIMAENIMHEIFAIDYTSILQTTHLWTHVRKVQQLTSLYKKNTSQINVLISSFD